MTPTQALQVWLALEHEAVWLHPVIGARFADLADRARESYTAHRAMRDQLLARLHALDVDPVPSKLGYAEGALRTNGEASAAARRVEQRIAAACLTLAGVSRGDDRKYAISGLRRAALAELGWGGKPSAFPGLP